MYLSIGPFLNQSSPYFVCREVCLWVHQNVIAVLRKSLWLCPPLTDNIQSAHLQGRSHPPSLPSITGLSILPPLRALHSRLPPLCPLIFALPLTVSLFEFKPFYSAPVSFILFGLPFNLWSFVPLSCCLTHGPLSGIGSGCEGWSYSCLWLCLSLLRRLGPCLSKIHVMGGGGLDATPHAAVGPRWSAVLAIQLHQHPLPLSVLHTNREGFSWWDCFQFTSELLTGVKTVNWMFFCK